MGLRVSDFASVSHIFAFLSSHSGLDFKMPVSASLGFTICHPLFSHGPQCNNNNVDFNSMMKTCFPQLNIFIIDCTKNLSAAGAYGWINL